jgi:hypothetical protein
MMPTGLLTATVVSRLLFQPVLAAGVYIAFFAGMAASVFTPLHPICAALAKRTRHGKSRTDQISQPRNSQH